jgi:hypothetical protein
MKYVCEHCKEMSCEDLMCKVSLALYGVYNGFVFSSIYTQTLMRQPSFVYLHQVCFYQLQLKYRETAQKVEFKMDVTNE